MECDSCLLKINKNVKSGAQNTIGIIGSNISNGIRNIYKLKRAEPYDWLPVGSGVGVIEGRLVKENIDNQREREDYPKRAYQKLYKN